MASPVGTSVVSPGQGQWGIQQGAQVRCQRSPVWRKRQREVGADAGIQDFQFNLCRRESFSIDRRRSVVLQEPGAPACSMGPGSIMACNQAIR